MNSVRKKKNCGQGVKIAEVYFFFTKVQFDTIKYFSVAAQYHFKASVLQHCSVTYTAILKYQIKRIQTSMHEYMYLCGM